MKKTEAFLETETENVLPAYNRFPIVIERGEGSKLYDIDGKEYIDFVGGIAVNSLGYNNPGIKKAIDEQFDKVEHISNLYWSEPLVRASKRLADAAGMDEVFFTNSGAEAIEGALKLARRYQSFNKGEDATEIIAMNGSFHGRTYGAVTVTGKPEYHEHFGPMLPGVVFAEFNDIDSIKNLIGEKTAAVIIEPIKGEGGIIPADETFLRELRELCDETKTLLIFDEVQCGASRSGSFTAKEAYGVEPEIMAMAKGIGGGFPVGAILAKRDVGEYLAPGTHGTTYGGNPLAAAVVDYVVSQIASEEFLEEVREKGDFFRSKLEELKAAYPDIITDVRGKGLMLAIELSVPVSYVINNAMENGLLLVSAAGNSIRFVPPLVITREEIEDGVKILEEAIKASSH